MKRIIPIGLIVFLLSINSILAQQIQITTTSGSSNWSPVRVSNSGQTLSWTASNSNIGTLVEGVNDPSFNFIQNSDGSLINIVVNGGAQFQGLSNLRITSSSIRSIDLSQTTDLKDIFLTGNAISEIDISGNSSLQRLLLATNLLTTLDIEGNTSINDLRLNDNLLPSSVLDKIVNDLAASGVVGGILRLSNNAGSLTGSSRDSYDLLLSRSWNIDVGTPPAAPNDQEAPSAVTDLRASGTTITGTQLLWTASSDDVGVTDYEVFQNGQSIGTTGGSLFFNVTGLSAETSYSFTVFAKDAVGNTSLLGNTLNLTTLEDVVAPSAINDLAFSNITFNSVDLTWSASFDNIEVTDYEVFQDGSRIGLTNGLLTLAVNGLSALNTYEFTVFAIDAAGNTSLVSNSVFVTTSAAPDNEAPSIITDLSASNISYTSVELLWTAPFDNVGVTEYEVFQDDVSIGLTGGQLNLTVSNLIPGATYNFTVFAKDAMGNTSEVSNTEQVITLIDNTSPSGISNLSSANTLMTTTELNWTASSDNVGVIDYEVFQDGSGIGSSGGATTFSVSGLSSNTTYSFTVRAKDAAGNTSDLSNTASVTTLSAIDYTSENSNNSTTDWESRDLFANGNLGIGTKDTQGYRLAVAGNVVAEEVKVALQTNWPDYVFKKQYSLPSLSELEAYIIANGHLIGIPSEKEVKAEGIQLGAMNAKLLEKIEELTLYTIQQQAQIDALKNQYSELVRLINKKLEKRDEFEAIKEVK